LDGITNQTPTLFETPGISSIYFSSVSEDV
jgi:hypothetical protein